jgi:tRNA (guanine-N7-)-methyltransferase
MKRKLERFEIIAGRENVIQPGKEIYGQIKGSWNELYFKNSNPITIELACGRGEYTIGLARLFPERNFIGVDIKGDRIWKGSTLAAENNLRNVGFLRTHILMIENFFNPGEVDEIWLTFPDPRPRKRDCKRRLTSPRYLEIYKALLRSGGTVRLKTDNTGLFEYSLEEIRGRVDATGLEVTHDLYDSALRPECFEIRTRYEELFAGQGEKIKYLRFGFGHSSLVVDC